MLPALTSAAMTTHMKIFWPGSAASNQNSGGTSHSDARTAISRQIVPVLAGYCSAYSRIMPKPHRAHAAHEAEQQRGAEPQPQLEIVGGVAKADDHHRRGQDLDRDRRRNQPDERIDLRLADRLADPVARRQPATAGRSIAAARGPAAAILLQIEIISAHAMPFRLASSMIRQPPA